VTSDFNVCHEGTPGDEGGPVFLESSNGGSGMAALGCVGCHGRDEDDGNATSTGTSQRGAGLRQHHVGSANCGGVSLWSTGVYARRWKHIAQLLRKSGHRPLRNTLAFLRAKKILQAQLWDWITTVTALTTWLMPTAMGFLSNWWPSRLS